MLLNVLVKLPARQKNNDEANGAIFSPLIEIKLNEENSV